MAVTAIKNGLGATVRFLNQPTIKEGIKNVASTAAFAFGLIEACDVYHILRGREISTETDKHPSKRMQIANKVILLCAKTSLILSAATSRPGVFIISKIVGQAFSNKQLDHVFGPNTIFAVNPWHPRHVCSIAAVTLALPSVVQSTYRGMHWVYDQLTQSRSFRNGVEGETSWLTDSKVRLMTLFNTIGSRPVQHLGNLACRSLR